MPKLYIPSTLKTLVHFLGLLGKSGQSRQYENCFWHWKMELVVVVDFYFRSTSIQNPTLPLYGKVGWLYLLWYNMFNVIMLQFSFVLFSFFPIHLLYAVVKGGRFIFLISCFWKRLLFRWLRVEGQPLGIRILRCVFLGYRCFFFLVSSYYITYMEGGIV